MPRNSVTDSNYDSSYSAHTGVLHRCPVITDRNNPKHTGNNTLIL